VKVFSECEGEVKVIGECEDSLLGSALRPCYRCYRGKQDLPCLLACRYAQPLVSTRRRCGCVTGFRPPPDTAHRHPTLILRVERDFVSDFRKKSMYNASKRRHGLQVHPVKIAIACDYYTTIENERSRPSRHCHRCRYVSSRPIDVFLNTDFMSSSRHHWPSYLPRSQEGSLPFHSKHPRPRPNTDNNQAGIKYSLFERDVSLNYRSNEWTMAIHWSLPLLKEILPEEVYSKLPEIACNPTLGIHSGLYPIINGDTGDMITGVPYTNGLRVPRSKMRSMCSEGINVQVSGSLSKRDQSLSDFEGHFS
jgi:hypothetical protein